MSSDEEFRQFASARSPALFRTAWLLCGDWHLAEDLVQTALGRLYRHWGSVRRAGNQNAYARAVLVKAFLSHQRRRSSRERPTEVVQEAVGEVTDPALRVVLLAALAQLPAKDRAVVVLRYWEDLSVEQTAEQLGMTAGAVRNRAQRALARLRGLLGGELTELGSM